MSFRNSRFMLESLLMDDNFKAPRLILSFDEWATLVDTANRFRGLALNVREEVLDRDTVVDVLDSLSRALKSAPAPVPAKAKTKPAKQVGTLPHEPRPQPVTMVLPDELRPFIQRVVEFLKPAWRGVRIVRLAA